MIYFGGAVRRQLVEELHRLIRPGGYLLIGHAETLLGMDEGFAFEAPSVYRRLE
jgi:chemotaxis protein methyltransferase CheR